MLQRSRPARPLSEQLFLCVMPCRASYALEHTRKSSRTLLVVSTSGVTMLMKIELTDAMSTREFPIAFRSQLITLVAGSTYTPSNGRIAGSSSLCGVRCTGSLVEGAATVLRGASRLT